MRFSLAIVTACAGFLGASAAPPRSVVDMEARWPWSSKSPIKFAQCSKSQQSQIKDAVKRANSYISDATKHLAMISKTGKPTERYTTWFGPYSKNSVKAVREHFEDIGDNPSRVTYHCKHDKPNCTPTAGVLVFLDKPGDVYLCNSFWRKPSAGMRSKAGTIVNEFTRFFEYGGTGDFANGPSAAKALAVSNPTLAASNADSYEFFAVNVPRLS
ncbi:hypothetical protein FRC07_006269 [Ceratobasidium sp. 392]|nr:hypothetical protein FRC07_006269 [Ceratobasidium sp. 392]